MWLAESALREMSAEATRLAPLETGGVLLGWQNGDGGEVVIATVLGPGPGASHHRTRFSPDSTWQRREISCAYESSMRRLSYLGDWHSHPRGSATPSSRDTRTAKRIARARHARCGTPLIVILTESDGWHATTYRLTEGCLRKMDSEPVSDPWGGVAAEMKAVLEDDVLA